MPCWLLNWMPFLTFLGSFIGPAIAAGALWHAIKRADIALKDWRVQRLAERDADVARDALKIALRYSAIIVQVSIGRIMDKDRSKEEEFNAQWSVFDKLDNEFNDTIWLVRAQLGDLEADAVEAIWKAKCRLYANQWAHLGSSDGTMFDLAFGDKAIDALELAEKRTRVRDLLTPHIRMEAIKRPSDETK